MVPHWDAIPHFRLRIQWHVYFKGFKRARRNKIEHPSCHIHHAMFYPQVEDSRVTKTTPASLSQKELRLIGASANPTRVQALVGRQPLCSAQEETNVRTYPDLSPEEAPRNPEFAKDSFHPQVVKKNLWTWSPDFSNPPVARGAGPERDAAELRPALPPPHAAQCGPGARGEVRGGIKPKLGRQGEVLQVPVCFHLPKSCFVSLRCWF